MISWALAFEFGVQQIFLSGASALHIIQQGLARYQYIIFEKMSIRLSSIMSMDANGLFGSTKYATNSFCMEYYHL